MQILVCSIADLGEWTQLRAQLWPMASIASHAEDVKDSLSNGRVAGFLARNEAGEAIGFAEASLRHDYVNGCSSSPVLFLEGIYVRPADRRLGVARALCNAVAAWGRHLGCTEFGSDALLENSESHSFHAALGFNETERVIFFRKAL
jgi:aminoglycoside 6'-N-acetyltransferase I